MCHRLAVLDQPFSHRDSNPKPFPLLVSPDGQIIFSVFEELSSRYHLKLFYTYVTKLSVLVVRNTSNAVLSDISPTKPIFLCFRTAYVHLLDFSIFVKQCYWSSIPTPICINTFYRITQLLSCFFRKGMPKHMFFRVGRPDFQFKVINPVVKCVAIDVMNDFVKCQFPSEVLFHNITMFVILFPIDLD